jgi:GNAT superfamily N-acetyltransferase
MSIIRPCTEDDFAAAWKIINAAATAYAGVIPDDCYHVPYMSEEALRGEIDDGVRFWGWFEGRSADGGSSDNELLVPLSSEALIGVMGIQAVDDVTLIRHAYVEPSRQGRGIGGELLARLMGLAQEQLLVGTWAAATWAIRFYERHGFRLVMRAEKDRLLRRYWCIPERQVETSVVLRHVRTAVDDQAPDPK